MDKDYEFIVIGAGGAGLAAAAAAADAGCTVLVIESEERLGGSTARSDGVFNAADTSVQRALGLRDSIDAYYDYYMTLNAWRQPASLIRAFCENATPTLEWLFSLGVQCPARQVHKVEGAVYPCAAGTPGLYASGVEWPPRGHVPVGGGQAYIDVLEQRCGALGVQIVLGTRVHKILVEDGAVVGVEVAGLPVRSHAVAITCGGFGHDETFLRKYFPDAYLAFGPGEHPTTISAPGSRGDGIRLGLQAKALIAGVNCGLLGTMAYIRKTPMRGFPGFQPTSLIYVNREGRRFAPETAPYAVMPGLIKAEGGVVWGVFDEAARLRSDPSKGGYAQGWDPAFVLDAVATGDFKSSPTMQGLAEGCGIGAPALAAAVQQYNDDLGAGLDRHFLRSLKGLHPIADPPFYAFEYRPCDVNLTGAGVRIDGHGRALNSDAVPIPGLYAAGESGAGVLGERYVGGGNAVANALTMGRVVGLAVGAALHPRPVRASGAAPGSLTAR